MFHFRKIKSKWLLYVTIDGRNYSNDNLDGIFNMIMMCEVSDSADLSGIQKALIAEGDRLGVQILAQNAAIFLSMHRVG